MSELKKKLSLYGLTMIAIGSCIGSGIFLTPNVVTQNMPHVGLILGVWLLGGIISIFGALTFAELGSEFPKSGGVYVYIKEAFGDLPAFLYGWVILLVINTGALAALSIAMVNFLGLFFDIGDGFQTVLAAILVVFLTILNIFGIAVSEWLANLFTGAKLVAIILIILIAFATTTQLEMKELIDLQESTIPTNLFSAFFLSLIGVFWSFGGWHHTSYLSEEAKNASRNIPLAMIIGTGIVTVAYVLVNYAYMQALPLSEIARSERVAGDALEAYFPGGGKYIAILVIISITGTVAIYTMSAPRIYFAMARDGLFFKGLSKVHPRFRTPVNAMILQAVWAVILIFIWKKFVTIITFVTFMDILFMMLGASCIFVFRRRKVDAPIKAWGYPILPALYVLITGIFVVNTAISLPSESWAGLIILLGGIPVYYWFKGRDY
jgi:APA family basic amino acid/polyamine antiporter